MQFSLCTIGVQVLWLFYWLLALTVLLLWLFYCSTVQVLWLFYSESTQCRKAVACKECKYPPCELKDTSELCHTDPPLWVPGRTSR